MEEKKFKKKLTLFFFLLRTESEKFVKINALKKINKKIEKINSVI